MRILALVLALLIAAPAVSAAPPVTIEVTPKLQLVVTRGTGDVWLKLTIERDARNRAVCVAVDGPYFRQSCFEHRGERAQYRTEWLVRGLPVGRYVVIAKLEQVGKDGEPTFEYGRDDFRVVGVGGEGQR